jgi:hypothetical protein
MKLSERIDRILYCPLIEGGEYPLKVRAPTFLHRWWRKYQFWMAKRDAARRGAVFTGAWDDFLWMESQEVRATRRSLPVEWSADARQDFYQEFHE